MNCTTLRIQQPRLVLISYSLGTASVLLCEGLRCCWGDVSGGEGGDPGIKLLRAVHWHAVGIRRLRDLGLTKGWTELQTNLSAQIRVWNSSQSGFLLLSSPNPKLGRAVPRLGSAQSSPVQHPERVPDNHSTPWNRNIHISRACLLLSNTPI